MGKQVDHKHKWRYGDNQDPMGTPDWWKACDICSEIMSVEEIARRLNATECLSTVTAAYFYAHGALSKANDEALQELRAYARVLEGGAE